MPRVTRGVPGFFHPQDAQAPSASHPTRCFEGQKHSYENIDLSFLDKGFSSSEENPHSNFNHSSSCFLSVTGCLHLPGWGSCLPTEPSEAAKHCQGSVDFNEPHSLFPHVAISVFFPLLIESFLLISISEILSTWCLKTEMR